MQFLNCWYEVFELPASHGSIQQQSLLGEAAVLVPVTAEADPCLILTRRAKHLASHPGQVSFPGGMWESVDQGLHQTALRETQEEIGLPPQGVTLVGELSRRVSRYGVGVTPYAALVDPALTLVPSADEIELIFQVPLRFFLQQKPHRIDRVERNGVRYHMPAWFWHEHEIWGLTALILAEFCSRVCSHPQAVGEWSLSTLEEQL